MINVQIDTTKEDKCTLKIAVKGAAGVLADECAAVIGHMTLMAAKTLKMPLEVVATLMSIDLPKLAAQAQKESSKDEGKEIDDEIIKESVEELLRESGACRGDNAESTDD